MSKTAIIAITKHGIKIAKDILNRMPEVQVYAPLKHKDNSTGINWYDEQTSKLVGSLFSTNDSLICIFSLGAAIRMLAPFLKDKKTDPAVLVIDDAAKFVVSSLSGHIGGANALARHVASLINAQPIITTAADVNETIAVDLVGKQFGWKIENYENVTKVSAHMVNEEKIAIFQESGERNWWEGKLPGNVVVVDSLKDTKKPDFKAALVISDRNVSDPVLAEKSVIYRPKSLVVGIGLHRDTSEDTVELGIKRVFDAAGLAFTSIKNLASINREGNVKGLVEFCSSRGIPLETFPKEKLAIVPVPNPSATVKKFEGTTSVSEAAALLSSNGNLIVQKQKFPPDLTVAVCRIRYT